MIEKYFPRLQELERELKGDMESSEKSNMTFQELQAVLHLQQAIRSATRALVLQEDGSPEKCSDRYLLLND